jgi:hypothetical protein
VSAEQNLKAVSGARARSLSPHEYARIEREADKAAREGSTRNDACPYPFGSDEGVHWTACFLLKGGKL